MKYGIFGGTFDPPHRGHMHIAEAALAQLNLDEVIWVPANKNPLKRRVQSSTQDRLKMCELAIEGHEKMAVSDIETSRGGQSFLVDTLREFKMVMPGEYWFILGADALATFDDWKEPQQVLEMCRLAAFARPGTDMQTVLSRLNPDVRSHIDLVTADVKGLSSSNIRDMAVKNEDWSFAVEPAVYAYIKENHIFKED